jgi:hypothetical protein
MFRESWPAGTAAAMPRTDRIAEPWGSRTPYGPGETWPTRVDQYLADGLTEDDVERWVQSASILHSNGDALDIAVRDGRIVGVRGRAVDWVNQGRLDPEDLFGWQANDSPDRLTRPLVPAGDLAGAHHHRLGAGRDRSPADPRRPGGRGDRGPDARDAARRRGTTVRLGLALEELHRSENALAHQLLAVAERHKVEHELFHVGRDLATWSQDHVRRLAAFGDRYGVRLDAEPAGEPALLLLRDLRSVFIHAQGVSADWEMVAQVAQGIRDTDLLALAQRCHPQTVRQATWANSRIKESATQILVS